MNLAGHEFIERELIRRVLMNMRPRRGERYKPRWVLVMGLFGFGSTVARAMCQEFALDPDEEIK